MRVDQLVLFHKNATPPVFDPSTGDYTDGTQEPPIEMYCHVSDTGEKRMTLLYGSITRGAKTIRLNNETIPPFDYIMIGGIKYKETLSKTHRRKSSLDVVAV